ncbi:MAG: hypothetical protein JWM47_1407 [Acidimicrobiales bacterium]|nr:hypothetical protein [Acidimicrobiales bacterium]
MAGRGERTGVIVVIVVFVVAMVMVAIAFIDNRRR